MRKLRVYHDRRPLRVALQIAATAVVLAVALCIFAFFWFQRYIVVENGELRLELPWESAQLSPEQ